MIKDENAPKKIYTEAIGNSELEKNDPLVIMPIEKTEEDNLFLRNSLNKAEEESALLRELFNNASNELNSLKKPALLVADVVSVLKDKSVIKLPNGNKFYCYVAKEVQNIRSGDSVLVDQKTLNIVGKVDQSSNFEVEKFVIIEKPKESWKDIGGLQNEIREVKEVIELPLKKPHLFEKIGIQPPKGALLYGPPGTGKTLLAKAVAHSTNATFIEVV